MQEVPLFKVFMPPDVDEAILKTLHSGYVAEGPRVREFQSAFGSFVGNPQAVPMASCTMALTISYDLAGIGAGDEVITTPLTSICTNMPFVHSKAEIVWADVEKTTGMIDPKKLPELITKKTKAIVVLHKDGDLAKMDEIMDVARAHDLKVIEDAAHTLGAKYKGRPVGSLSDYTCFSLQAIKHITSGDGGVLTVKDEKDLVEARKMKWMGVDKESLTPGTNPWTLDITTPAYKANMNDITATIALASMAHASSNVEKYHRNGELYTKLLKDVPGVTLIERDPTNYPVYWTYVILVEDRERLIAALKEEGIAASHVHPRNDDYGIFSRFKRALPGVDYFAPRELSLPSGWWVTEEDIGRIVDIIKKTV